MDEIKLLPCPFCGFEDAPDIKTIHHDLHDIYTAICPNCFIETNAFITEKEALEFWNTRANTIQVGGGENYEVIHNETT